MLRVATSFRRIRRASSLRSWSPRVAGCIAEEREPARSTNETIVVFTPQFLGQKRLMSTSPGDDDNSEMGTFDETMKKLFAEQDASSAVVDAASATASTALPWDPHWYNLADQAINVVNFFHEVTGFDLAYSIVGVTCLARVLLFPVFVKGQRSTSRMAHMQPELQAIKSRMEQLGSDVDRETQIKYGLQMKALFKKYDCNPIGAAVVPFMQAPVFMSMFFGLRKMPDYFPDELSTGGILWFPDLTIPDPYFILPAVSALSFLFMIEMGKDQMMATNPAQGQVFVNVFRGMSVVMFPLACSFSTGLLCYWVTNNTITLMQSIAFRNATVRKSLGIWEMPKPVPGAAAPKSIMDSLKDATEKIQGKAVSDEEKMQVHNEIIEHKKKTAKLSKATRVRRDGRFARSIVKR